MVTLALALASLAPLALALASLWLITAAAPVRPSRLAPSLPLSEAEASRPVRSAEALAAERLASLRRVTVARSVVPSAFTLTVARSLRPLSLALAGRSAVTLTEADTEREALIAADALGTLAARLSAAASVMDARSVAAALVTAAETLATASEDAAHLMTLTLSEADTLRRYVSESRIKADALKAAAQRDIRSASPSLALVTEG